MPRPEPGRWLLMAAVLLLCLGALAAVGSGLLGSLPKPPPMPAAAALPTSAATSQSVTATLKTSYVSDEEGREAIRTAVRSQRRGRLHAFGTLQAPEVSGRWVSGFYRIYEEAEKAFHVNWLLIASIHSQETAFSTAAGTYHGLNFAGCCGGPMQFNVRNGPVSTWALVADSYRYARRPRVYDHMTRHHPSIYDDFDSIMAASHLLSLDGATYALNDAAWWAAYDYYGHDEYGVSYADEVIARAIGWSEHGFCPTCAVSGSLLDAVNAAYGAPVLEALRAQALRRRRVRARTRASRPHQKDLKGRIADVPPHRGAASPRTY